MVVNLGGLCGDRVTKQTDFLVLGNTDYCKTIKDGKSSKQKRAEQLKLSGSNIEILSEGSTEKKTDVKEKNAEYKTHFMI